MRNYEGKTRLQGIGVVDGIKSKNLKVGDVLVWNFGGTSTVKEITFSKTGKTLVIVEEFKGQDYTRRLGAERIVVVKELNPVEEVQAVEEVKEVKEVKEDKAVAFAKEMIKEVNKTVESLCDEEPAKAVQVVDKLIDKVAEFINSIDHEGVKHELRDLENYLKWVYASMCEIVEQQEKAIERDYQPTNKEVVIKELEAEGLVLGCWSDKIGNLSKHNLKKITDEIRYHSATDVVVRLRGKECVVSIDFVDNEVDFTLYSKAEYISRYGSEKFEV